MLPEGTCSTHGPVVSGIPKPEVAWFLEGIPVRRREGVVEIYEDGASHYLCLRRARMRDSGRYSCTASNSLGHVSCSWTLLVDREYISRWILGVVTLIGHLHASGSSGPTAPHPSWQLSPSPTGQGKSHCSHSPFLIRCSPQSPLNIDIPRSLPRPVDSYTLLGSSAVRAVP